MKKEALVKKALEELEAFHLKESKLSDFLVDGGYIDGYMISTISDGIETTYTKLISELIGDNNEWVDWFVYENDFGKKEMEFGYKDSITCKIKSIDDFIKLMEINKMIDELDENEEESVSIAKIQGAIKVLNIGE